MNIISKTRDYYDGYADYTNEDPKAKYWVREEQEIKINKYLIKNLEKDLIRTPWNFEAAYLIIAGKVYPYVSVKTDSEQKYIDGEFIYIDSHIDYYFDADSLLDRYKVEKEIYDKKIKKAKRKGTFPLYRSSWITGYIGNLSSMERDVHNFFNKDFQNMNDLCIENGTPVISIRPHSYRYREEKKKDKDFRTCVKNVNLKEHGLSKLLSAPEIYQILDMFVSNVLVKDEMPISPMTDKEKIQSHGFDNKLSFRHPVK